MEHYEIRLRGHLDSSWSDWFEGLAIINEADQTVLRGLLRDQAALYGILLKIRDLGLELLSLNPTTFSRPGSSLSEEKSKFF